MGGAIGIDPDFRRRSPRMSSGSTRVPTGPSRVARRLGRGDSGQERHHPLRRAAGGRWLRLDPGSGRRLARVVAPAGYLAGRLTGARPMTRFATARRPICSAASTSRQSLGRGFGRTVWFAAHLSAAHRRRRSRSSAASRRKLPSAPASSPARRWLPAWATAPAAGSRPAASSRDLHRHQRLLGAFRRHGRPLHDRPEWPAHLHAFGSARTFLPARLYDGHRSCPPLAARKIRHEL